MESPKLLYANFQSLFKLNEFFLSDDSSTYFKDDKNLDSITLDSSC